MDIVSLFCAVDDFNIANEATKLKEITNDGKNKRNRKGNLSKSEIMTILL
jgi:hypothetical protein